MLRADAKRPGKHAFLDRRGGGFLLDGLANLLVDARNAHKDRGANFLHGLGQLVEVRAVGDLRAVAVHHVVERAGGDMRERKKGDAGVGFIEVKFARGEVLVGGDVAVREHDALGLAGGAGGVDQSGQIVGLDGADQGVEDRVAIRAGIVGAGKNLGKAMAPSGALPSMMRIRSSCVWERTALSLSNCWRVETTAMRQPASARSTAICSPVSVG